MSRTPEQRQRYEEEPREREESEDATDSHLWLPIYRFQFVDYVGVLSRMKLYTSLVALAVPTVLPKYIDLTPGEFQMAVALAVVGTLTLATFARVTTRLIGVISLHKDEDLIRVGYLTFWGKRRNVIVPVANILPFSDYLDPTKLNTFSMKADLRRADATGPLYIPTFGMEIVDRKGFLYVFGPSFFTDTKSSDKNTDSTDNNTDKSSDNTPDSSPTHTSEKEKKEQ